jgi:histidinol-phosphate aminotransferase
MAYEYERVTQPASGLRLHLNENTAGCSPRVLAALHGISREQAACYPDYEQVTRVCADRFGVASDQLLLTNGLDEAVLGISITSLRRHTDLVPEAIVVVPAFDMYPACADAAGGRVVEVSTVSNFEFPIGAVLQAVTPATRLIFITTPNNPTGRSVPFECIFRIAREAAAATVFVDEAYADFSGESLIGHPNLAAHPNVIIGRTFSKAYGLAGLRIGALIGAPDALAPIRRVLPPFSLNACAVAALGAALDDVAYYEWYVGQVLTSKSELYAALNRLNVRYWPSDANFVLVDFGPDVQRIVAGLAERQVHVRDKSRDTACPNCVRITTGVVEHTRACIVALEEVLCGEES